MAEIFDFVARKNSAPKPTPQELAINAVDEIASHWEKFASNNRLNDYFIQHTPVWSQPSVNYLEDLSALSILEQKIGLEPQIIAPGFTEKSQLGWVAAFRTHGITVVTPYMINEAYARCFNILLFLKIKRDLTTHKL